MYSTAMATEKVTLLPYIWKIVQNFPPPGWVCLKLDVSYPSSTPIYVKQHSCTASLCPIAMHWFSANLWGRPLRKSAQPCPRIWLCTSWMMNWMAKWWRTPKTCLRPCLMPPRIVCQPTWKSKIITINCCTSTRQAPLACPRLRLSHTQGIYSAHALSTCGWQCALH